MSGLIIGAALALAAAAWVVAPLVRANAPGSAGARDGDGEEAPRGDGGARGACPACGAPLEADARFCSNCGGPVA